MASTPFKRALFVRIKNKGGWSWVLEQIASGVTVSAVSKELECSRSFLSRMLTRRSQPKLHQAYLAAKLEAAAAHADEATRLIDEVEPERDALHKAKLQAEHRRWLAGVYDRETFGQREQNVNVLVNNGSLHLAALQAAKPIMIQPRKPALDALPVLEAEVVDEAKPEHFHGHGYDPHAS